MTPQSFRRVKSTCIFLGGYREELTLGSQRDLKKEFQALEGVF